MSQNKKITSEQLRKVRKVLESYSPPKWVDDEAAEQENESWLNYDELVGNQKKANEFWEIRIFGWAVRLFMAVFALLFLSSVIIWSLHLLTPVCWLEPDQLSKIQSIIFSGSLGAIVSQYFRSRFVENKG